MRLRTLSTLLSDVLSHLPGAEYERAKCDALAAQVSEQRAHIEDLARRLEYTTRQKDEAEEREAEVSKDAEARLNAVWHHIGEKKTLTDERDAARDANARLRTQSHDQADALLTANSDLAAVKEERDAEKASHENTVRDRNARIAERNEARSERDEWKRNCESVQIDRETVKARYEAEKAAHGETQRHLTAAIAERDEARRDCESQRLARVKTFRDLNDAITERNAAEAERDALRARVAELQAGEPVAWRVDYERAPGEHCCWFAVSPGEMKRLGPVGKLTPLFEAPQPAAPAYGVEEERFVCWKGACMWLTDDDDDEGARDTGTRVEVEARAKKIAGSKVMRLVDADAPVVDVDKIREALNTLRGIRIWTAGDLQSAADAFAAIASAIGEES